MTRPTVNIAKFLSRDGRVIQIPAKTKTLMPVLQYITSKLDGEKKYTQPEINEALLKWHAFSHSDTIRRYLVEREFLCRTDDGRSYWISESSEPEEQYWKWHRKDMENKDENTNNIEA